MTGELLWEHRWQVKGMSRVTQPLVIGDDVVIGTGVGRNRESAASALRSPATGGT